MFKVQGFRVSEFKVQGFRELTGSRVRTFQGSSVIAQPFLIFVAAIS